MTEQRDKLTLQQVLDGKRWEPTPEERKDIERRKREEMEMLFEDCGFSSWVYN